MLRRFQILFKKSSDSETSRIFPTDLCDGLAIAPRTSSTRPVDLEIGADMMMISESAFCVARAKSEARVAVGSERRGVRSHNSKKSFFEVWNNKTNVLVCVETGCAKGEGMR